MDNYGGRLVMIKKVKGGYQVVSEKSGKNLGGPYKTKEEAAKRLRQVEYFKHSTGITIRSAEIKTQALGPTPGH
jgi:hypothetical protein